MSDSEPLLAARGLHAFYGRAHILADLSLEIGRGEILALLGRNGAGKSTTMKTIMGLIRPARGSVHLEGRRLDGLAPHRIARAGLGYVPEDRRIFTELTVLENLEVGRQQSRAGAPSWTAERLFALFPNLAELRDRPGGQMSGGEQQMLTIARTLMGNPSIILLDEPSEGLAPKIVEQMARTILGLKSEGLSVLLAEQNLHFARHVADRATIIEKGRVRYTGSMAELARNDEVQRDYLSA
jgi:branched-chain amino acid transport system ATP-binding protein